MAGIVYRNIERSMQDFDSMMDEYKAVLSQFHSVAILTEHSDRLLAAVMAAYKYGVPFLPLSMEMGSDRINYILKIVV